MAGHGGWVILLLLMTACAIAPERPVWPADLPPRAYYEQVYEADPGNQRHQTRAEYLDWVRSFYSGWAGVRGWHSIRNEILADMDAGQDNAMRARLEDLGRRISGEWAKSRGQRVISGETIQTWINATYEAGDRRDYESLLIRISRDVDALLAGKLEPSTVTLQRYYPDARSVSPFDGLQLDSPE